MARIFRFRNYGLYVWDERGSPHRLPHAHVKNRGRRVASVYLMTVDLFNVVEDLPDDLVAQIKSEQESLLAKWAELNGD